MSGVVASKLRQNKVSTRGIHKAPRSVSVMLFGSCYLILSVSSAIYFQIVSWQCCLKRKWHRLSFFPAITLELQGLDLVWNGKEITLVSLLSVLTSSAVVVPGPGVQVSSGNNIGPPPPHQF